MKNSTINMKNDWLYFLSDREIGYSLLGIGLFLFLWQILSIISSEFIIASPYDTFFALIGMVRTMDFWKNLVITLERFSLSLVFGSLVGIIFGIAAGIKVDIKRLLEPIRWALMSVPPVILVTVCMIWFGIGNTQIIAATSLLIMPIMYINTIEGVQAVESNILEMGEVYQASFVMLLREIYLPGIAGPVLAGLTLAAGMGIRIVVLAEVLGAFSGIGYKFSLARINLQTPELFAWIIMCLFLVGLFEFGILNPLRSHILRWKRGD